MASAFSEDQFRCTICLDILRNPVTIPCGHNFCMVCIKRYWDKSHKSECPLCKETFKPRPELRINVGLKDIIEKYKESIRGRPSYKPVPPIKPARSIRLKERQRRVGDEVPCDSCQENFVAAIKSCFVCQLSYCGLHLTPHLSDPVLTKHSLTDPAIFVASHFCRHHNKPMNMFCKRDQTPVCIRCRESDHKHHETVSIEEESRKVRTAIKKIEGEFDEMVQARLIKLKEINTAAELSKKNQEQEIQKSLQVINRVVSVIEKNQASLLEEIEKKQEAARGSQEQLCNELGNEIIELQKRRSDLQHLEHSDDNLHLLQSFPLLSAPMLGRNWSEVRVHSVSYMGAVRRSFTKLVEVCHELEKNLSAEEMSMAYQYAVDVTLDPVTASGWLCLSEDGKQVSLSQQQKKLSPPDDPRRFDSCVSVLGKQCFTAGKHYWVVQVGNKTDWDLGLAKESISRKGTIMVCPDNGYWAICRRKAGSLSACAGPCVTLKLQETPQKVSVFLDYEEGSVSFHDAEAKTHIYTFSGCNFTEPLYPYLNPCLHDNGKNIAPLIICPVGETEVAF
ncbi:E3 ubiquitin-protein ligase TRIM39-like [Clinocottus analis]|uniref:E3 ubiquitin-protein ligase TRIM39-like n=1 Tax=Clinocottus analis TaxID=304258 RepID=UPI0035BECBBE